jgi:hypothetical protein
MLFGIGWYLAIDVSGQSFVASHLTTYTLQHPRRAKAPNTPRLNYEIQQILAISFKRTDMFIFNRLGKTMASQEAIEGTVVPKLSEILLKL